MRSMRPEEVKHFRGKVWVPDHLTPGQDHLIRPVIVKLVHRAVGFQAPERGYENQASRSSSLSNKCLTQVTLEILVE